MAYLVLARKYRPQRFEDVTGQEHVVRTLSNALRSGRVAHAYLFTGPRGCGKTTSARLLARAMNCEKGPTPSPCGVCAPCTEIAAGTDLDVQELDAASNRGVDDVRLLREAAKYLPARDRHKVFIVDEVHMLTDAAANALLKTLEEPPGHVKFLLATTDPQKLPATILSRCQRHGFRLVPVARISDRLQQICDAEQVKIEPGALALVARQAAGSMRDALSLLDQVFSAAEPGQAITEAQTAESLGALDRRVVLEFALSLVRRDAGAALGAIQKVYDGGHDPRRLAEEAALSLRNMLAAQTPGAPIDAPDHEAKALTEASKGVDPVHLARLFDLMQSSVVDLAEKAANPRFALEAAALRAIHLAPGAGINELLLRAEKLAERLAKGVGLAPHVARDAGVAPKKAEAPETPAPAEAVQSAPTVRSVQSVQSSRIVDPIASDESQPLAARWASLVEWVRAKKKPLASHLDKAIPVSIGERTIELAFRETFSRERVEEPDARAVAEAAFSDALGRKVALKLVAPPVGAAAAAPVDTLADSREKADRAASEDRKRATREHPVVQSLVQALGAVIDDVKDLG